MIDAILQIKIKAITAHLWFEEIIRGERDENMEVIWDTLDQADGYAQTLLAGKESPQGTIARLDDPEFRRDIIEVKNKLREFRDMTKQRFETRTTADSAKDIRDRYHSTFTTFIHLADKLRARLNQIMEQDLHDFLSKQTTLLVTCLSMALLIGAAFFYFERFRGRNIRKLHEANTLMEREIAERKQAEVDLSNSHEQLRKLNNRLQDIREEEKAHISREIHDELGQSLTALKFSLSLIKTELSHKQQGFLDAIQSMSELVDSTVQSVQRITMELRPQILDIMGLCEAFEWQVEEYQNRTKIQCELSCDLGNTFIDRDRSITLFRICQEALTNVARHAKATSVQVSLSKIKDYLVLQIKDNGKGIEDDQIENAKSLGLLGIRERVKFWGGEVDIRGITGKGTTISAKIPCNE